MKIISHQSDIYKLKIKVDVDNKLKLLVRGDHCSSSFWLTPNEPVLQTAHVRGNGGPAASLSAGLVHTSTCHPQRSFHQFVSVSI